MGIPSKLSNYFAGKKSYFDQVAIVTLNIFNFLKKINCSPSSVEQKTSFIKWAKGIWD